MSTTNPTAPHTSYVLAVDLGTGGPKVGLVSMTGTIVCAERLEVVTRTTSDGGATQDASEWWRLVQAAAGRCVDSGLVPPGSIAAVSCTGQWASTVPVDDHGVPVGECLLWSDTRGGPWTRRAVGGPAAGYSPAAVLQWIRRSGGAPSLAGADPIGHILFLEHEQRETARSARWYLEPVDYLSMRFTGVAAATPASMAGAWLTDNRHPDRLGYDPRLIRRSGVPVGKLPPLVPTGSIVGGLAAPVAEALGLRPGIPVVAGTPDLHSATAGAGTVLPYEAHVAVSTTSWISCPLPKKKTDPFRQIATVPGFTPGLNLVANNQETGGGALQWIRSLAPSGGDLATFEALTGSAGKAEAGSGGLIFTPWLDGERSPVDDRSARAGFHNLTLRTSRDEMLRAVLEGVAMNSRWLADAVERFIDRPLGTVRMIGGGATSKLWCQIYADVLDRTVEQVVEPVLANLRGSALLAALALGAIESPQVRALVPVEEVYRPDPAHRIVYDRLYAEFPALYSAQKKTFRRLNRP